MKARFGRLCVLTACAASISIASFACLAPAHAGPALLVDVTSGHVLFADEPDRIWHPASLTKLMTAYITFEAVKKGQLKLDTEVELSPKARAQPATRIGLRLGIKLNLDQAVRGLIMRSANDFAMALAETVAGSEEAFVERMNATAKRLGMTRTRFRNPHGLPDIEQVTTARDMVRLAHAHARDFPEFADVFSSPDLRIHKGTFHNGNDLLRTLPGADGMKTGFTCGAGYNVVASATRDGHRLVAVVLGEQNRIKRSHRASALLEHGFSTFAWKELGAPLTLATLPSSPPAVDEPIYTAGTMRIRRCASRRPVIEPSPEPDDADESAVASQAVKGDGKVAAKVSPGSTAKGKQ